MRTKRVNITNDVGDKGEQLARAVVAAVGSLADAVRIQQDMLDDAVIPPEAVGAHVSARFRYNDYMVTMDDTADDAVEIVVLDMSKDGELVMRIKVSGS